MERLLYNPTDLQGPPAHEPALLAYYKIQILLKKKKPTKPYVLSPATVKGNLRYDIMSTKCLIYQKKLALSYPVRGNQ